MKLFSIYILSVLLVMCKYLGAIDLPSGCLDAFRSSTLVAHNLLRSKHGSKSLTEDANLDASALNWANFMATNHVFKHSPTLVNTGENIYVSYSTYPLTTNLCSRNFSYLFVLFKVSQIPTNLTCFPLEINLSHYSIL